MSKSIYFLAKTKTTDVATNIKSRQTRKKSCRKKINLVHQHSMSLWQLWTVHVSESLLISDIYNFCLTKFIFCRHDFFLVWHFKIYVRHLNFWSTHFEFGRRTWVLVIHNFRFGRRNFMYGRPHFMSGRTSVEVRWHRSWSDRDSNGTEEVIIIILLVIYNYNIMNSHSHL